MMTNAAKILLAAVLALTLGGCWAQEAPDLKVSVRKIFKDQLQALIKFNNEDSEVMCVPRAEINLLGRMELGRGAITENPREGLSGVDISEGVLILPRGETSFGAFLPSSGPSKFLFHFSRCRELFSDRQAAWRNVTVVVSG